MDTPLAPDITPVHSRWTEALRHGARPSAETLREHLLSVHRRHAGFTEACAGRCRDDHGRNSYEWLVELIEPGKHRRILDLACGSGPLLDLCHTALPGATELFGVDMSADELALAADRLAPGAAALHEGMAQRLDFLADNSVDAVLCHWALTLMDPVEPVLSEVKRVLRPGGVFAAIVDGEMADAPSYQAINDCIYGWVQTDFPAYGSVDMGDARVRSATTLAELAATVFAGDESANGAGAAISLEGNVVRANGPSRALAEEAAGFFYSAFVLSPDSHAAMLGDVARILAAAGDGADATFSLPINRLVVQL